MLLQDVDQQTGEDLNPKQTRSIVGGDKDKADEARNPDRPTSMPLVTVPEQNDVAERRHAQRPSSPELWELKQMAAANVIDVSEMPGFDEETGLLPNDDDSGNVRVLIQKLCILDNDLRNMLFLASSSDFLSNNSLLKKYQIKSV